MQAIGKPKQHKYLFMLRGNIPEEAKVAVEYLREMGIRPLERHGNLALVALASDQQVETAYQSTLFLTISRGAIKQEHIEKLDAERQDIATLWSHIHSEKYHQIRKDVSHKGKSWNNPELAAPGPQTLISPEDFKTLLKEKLGVDEQELRTKYKKSRRKLTRLTDKAFLTYERKLEKVYKDPTIAYHLARIAWYLDPIYYDILLTLPLDIIRFFLAEPPCWKMKGEISVGVVFVESANSGGPKFSSSEKDTLRARISDGLSWLAGEAPSNALLTWVYDWQFVQINAANGNDSSDEEYWRNPAMGQISYNSNTYSQTWGAVAEYREDMRRYNSSQHAIVIFVTPYANSWHAYAGGGRLTLADRDNWGGWGINTVDEITSHEVCHLFGAADEYTGNGTPCSSCNTVHGCDSIPNGNCGACASPLQACIMDGNSPRLCAYTQGQIGWADLFVEVTTADETWAGTDDTVWLDIGDRTFELDTSNHDDRERNNVEGYAIVAPSLRVDEIKRVGIRKSSDGFSGGWKLERIRLWHQGTLVCDANNINQWLEDEYLWWASSSCGSSSTIVNRLQIKITTADVNWAGTDDDVRIYFGGRSWDLDNPGHNDFERGNTDTFDLDPGTGLYPSMINSVRIHKSPDGISGGWKLKGLQIYVNGSRIYNNQSINKWLEDDDRDWYGTL